MTTDGNPAHPAIAVLGPGGVGGLLAALLVRAGHRVVCLASAGTAAVLRERGLTVRSGQFGDFTVPVAADTVLRGPVALCLVTPKETSLADALTRVPPEALGTGLLVPLLNGFEHVGVVRGRYGDERVLPGTIRVESTRVAPGEIEHGSPFARIELASRTLPGARVAGAAELLASSGVAVTVRDGAEEDAMLWEKLSFLLPMALLCTRYDLPLGGVREQRRPELLAVVAEFAAVAAASGVRIDQDALVGGLDAVPYGMSPSMRRDAAAGRPLEVDAVGGALLRAASRCGVPAPAIGRLVAELSEPGGPRPAVSP